MTIGRINIEASVAKIQQQISKDDSLSPALVSSINVLIVVIQLLVERMGLNSANSSVPPSKDPKKRKEKTRARKKSSKNSGGQPGHKGETLEKVDDPDEVVDLEIDRRTLPNGSNFKPAGFETRQVIDVVMDIHVTEYRAEVLEDNEGNQYVAVFPDHLTKGVQYGSSVRALSTYLSQYQLIPYSRVQEVFSDQFGLNLSQGSINNFNKEAYEKLAGFEERNCQSLRRATVLNADETGIKIGDKNHWLHVLCAPKTTFFFAHHKRGKDAIKDMGVLGEFKGVLCHDGWKPYFGYECDHALCNAHHLRELEWVVEFKNHEWAKSMKKLLISIKKQTEASGGILKVSAQEKYIKKYRVVIQNGKKECPMTLPTKGSGKRKCAQTKERNLLDRLEKYEDWVLLFMKEKKVPFTNNRAERDIRMTKVHQKISGCFRSMAGAKYFCRIRSYLLTSIKRGHSPYQQMIKLFDPDYAE
jgi:transposase